MNLFKKIIGIGLLLGLTTLTVVAKEEKTYKKTTKKHTTHAKKHHPYTTTKKHTLKHEPTKIRKTSPTHPTSTKTSQESTYNRISNYLGLGGAAAAARIHGTTVHHRGPDGFFERHNFPQDWNGGWTGQWHGNNWKFGGYDLEWWKQNYPAYYRDVVRPEYTKAGGK